MDPNPEAFEEWPLNYPVKGDVSESTGAVSAMASSVLEEWRLAVSMDAVRIWLEHGVPSDDSEDDKPREPHSR